MSSLSFGQAGVSDFLEVAELDLPSTQEGITRGSEERREGSGAGSLAGHSSSTSQRPSVALAPHPTPPPSTATGGCVRTTAPPRPRKSLGQQYTKTCKKNRRLVKEGELQCSISLSDTPPTVNLPPAPSSPTLEHPDLGGSVHFGAVGDFSGVQTPYITPVGSPTRPTVIVPKSRAPLPTSVPRQQILPSQSLVEGISTLLQDVQSIPDSPNYQSTEFNYPSPSAGPVRLSSTDPHILTPEKILMVGSPSVSSIESEATEVFLPSKAVMERRDHLREEARHLQRLRRNLLQESLWRTMRVSSRKT